MTIGGRLRSLREKHNLGQKEIADILNISDSGYSCYENNLRIPTTKNLIKLAKYYNVSTDYILGIEQKCLNAKDISNRVNDLERQILEFKKYIDSFE